MTLWAHRSPSKTSRIGAKMLNAVINHLNSRHSLRFPRTRWDAIIYARRGPQTMGQGHNGAQNENPGVVPSVVGKMSAITGCYPPPTTLQRKIETYTHVCTCACARVRACRFFRCTVVSLSYVIERYKEKATTDPTTLGLKCQKALCLPLWAVSNPLEINKKGGFERG